MNNNSIVYWFRLRLGSGIFLHGLMLLTLLLLGQSQQEQNHVVNNNQQSDNNMIPPRRIQAFPNRDEVLKLIHEKGASIHSVSSSSSFTTSSASSSASSSSSSSSPPTISITADTNSTDNSGIDDNRVVGGTDADPTKYPFFTLIEIAKTFSDQTEAIDVCGGTLISSDIVLTAAHCFAEGKVMTISALINATSSETLTGFEYARDVTTHVTHPDFDAETFNYDVAILLLASPVTEVTPLLLNSDSNIPEDGEDLELLGLGLLEENGSFPEFLQVVTLQAIPITTCQENYAVYPDGPISVNATLQLCAAAPGKDACAADSGGPLIKTDGLSQLLVATVSFGIGCALPVCHYSLYVYLSIPSFALVMIRFQIIFVDLPIIPE
jgi:secreted trypsin-like serine protease